MHTRYEQAMLSSVQHPFIINLWGSFQDSANLYMVMDFVPGGELFTLLRRSNVSFDAYIHFGLCLQYGWGHFRYYMQRKIKHTSQNESTTHAQWQGYT